MQTKLALNILKIVKVKLVTLLINIYLLQDHNYLIIVYMSLILALNVILIVLSRILLSSQYSVLYK